MAGPLVRIHGATSEGVTTMTVRILIIEDHVDNLELMTYLLKSHGYGTLSASDGVTGLKVAGREMPELIVCDIQLPGMDGLEVARCLKQDARLRTIPLVAITAMAMVGDREKVLAAGFDGYIAKPIAPERFVDEIHVFLKPEQRRPARSATKAAAGAGEVDRDAAVKAPVATRGTILVVDNVDTNLELARSIFSPSGFEVVVASDVASAMEAAQKHKPDLILSDLNMPQASGFELILLVKSDPRLKPVPVVLISSTAPRDMSGDHAQAIGAARFIRRPIDPVDLLREIESCLEISRRASA